MCNSIFFLRNLIFIGGNTKSQLGNTNSQLGNTNLMLGNYNIPESKFHYFNVRGYKYDTFKYVNIRKTTLCVIANDVRQSHIKSDIEQKKNRTNEQLNFEIEKSLPG